MSTPTIINAKATPTSTSLVLTWGVSTEETLDKIRVYVRPHGTGPWVAEDVPASSRSHTFTGLSPGTEYDWELRPIIGGAAVTGTSTTSAPPIPPAPVLSVEGDTVSWLAIPSVKEYTFATVRNPATTRDTTYRVTILTSVTPPVVAGETVNYGCHASAPVRGPWAKEVSITYPPAPSPSGVFSPGLVSGSETLDYECTGQLGAKIVRLEWDISTPEAQMVAIIEAYAKLGVRVAPLAGFEGRIPTQAEVQNLAMWAKAYGPGGSFWANRTDGHLAVQTIEFGNETSYGYQYNDGYQDASYKERARVYAERAKEASDALAGTSVGLLVQASDGGSGSSVWVDEMFAAVPDLPKYASGWTVHPYASPWGTSMLGRMVTDLAKYGETTLPVDITEFGFATDNGRTLSDGSSRTYQQAAEQLKAQLPELKAAAKAHPIRLMMLYQVRDQKPTGFTTSREAYFGALQHEGQGKGQFTEAAKAFLAS